MKNRRIYIRLIISYIGFFCLPLLITIFTLEEIGQSTKEGICKEILTNAEHVRDIVDNHFMEIDTIIDKVSANSNILYIATMLDETQKTGEISRIIDAQKQISDMEIQSFQEEYYLFLHKPKMVLTPNNIFLDQENLKFFFQYDSVEWALWEEQMLEKYTAKFFPAAAVKQNTNEKEMFLYVQSLVTFSGNSGTFLFPIKTEKIRQLLTDSYIPKLGYAYVLNSDGEMILSLDSEEEYMKEIPKELLKEETPILEITYDGEELEIIRAESKYTGLSYIVVLPERVITEQINAKQRNIILLMSVVILLGVAGILFISWYRGKKIDNIMQVLMPFGTDEEEVKGDEMNYISHSLKQLISHNEELHRDILRHEPVTRAFLLERFLQRADEEALQNLEEYGVFLRGRRLLLIAFSIGEEDQKDMEANAGETAVYKQMLQKNIKDLFAGEQYLCDRDIHSGTFLLVCDEETVPVRSQLKGHLEEFIRQMWKEYGVHLWLTVGEACEDVEQVNSIYDKVHEMLEYGSFSGESILFQEDYSEKKDYYYFPVTLEERLVNAVKMGNTNNMHKQLTEVWQVNVMERDLSPAMMHFLMNDLQCAVFKALHGLESIAAEELEEIYAELEQLNRENDILLRLKRINGIFTTICEEVKKDNSENDNRQIEKIQEYIRNNCGSNDMSLTKIADDFGYASTYFSKLFKELFHENFAVYLEKVRIEEVCNLLKQDLTLEKIAEKTGYNSVYVMRTAFKRIKGMTPNEYRKLNS